MSETNGKGLSKTSARDILELTISGLNNAEISRRLKVNYKTIARRKASPEYKKIEEQAILLGRLKAPSEEEIRDRLTQLPEEFSREEAMSAAFDASIWLLQKTVEDIKLGYIVQDESEKKIPLKTLMECLEKASRYQATMTKANLESKQNRGISTQEFEYSMRKMADLYMKCKAENIEYDEKAHMKAVLDEVFGSDK